MRKIKKGGLIMDKKLALLAVAYCAVSGVKSLMDTAIVAAVSEIVKAKISQN